MRICIAGKNDIAVEICKYILTLISIDKLVVICNQTDNKKNGFQRSLKKFAIEKKITIVNLEDVYEWDDLVFLSLEFDKIIKPTLFKSKNLFNIHFSLLPSYKGMYTSIMPILNGEMETGVSFHKIEAGIDTGDIIMQTRIPIEIIDSSKSLYLKYIQNGIKLLKNILPYVLNNNYTSFPQTTINSTYYSKKTIDFNNIKINFFQTAYQVYNQIRAFCFRNYQLIKFKDTDIFYSKITEEKSRFKAGTVIEESKYFYIVATIDFNIVLYKDRFDELMNYCKLGDLSSLKNVVDLGKYIHEKEIEHGWNLIIVATYNHHVNIVEFLLQIGANINSINNNGTTLLMYAKDAGLLRRDYNLLFSLISKGADIYQRDYEGLNLFDYVKNQDKRLYEHLLESYK